MIAYTYSLILLLTVSVCFVASFDRRIEFYKHFSSFFMAAVLVAVPYILWDVWFTAKGVWWFNPKYTLGINIMGLPIEECLFFICIPFSCVFTYFCIDKFFKLEILPAFNNIIVFVAVIVCSVIAMLHQAKIYTFCTAVVTVFTLIYLHFFARSSWLAKASLVYTILMLGFFPVNGVLTGFGLESPIVNYNPTAFLGIRIVTIPIEDAVYGYSHFLWVLYFFKLFSK